MPTPPTTDYPDFQSIACYNQIIASSAVNPISNNQVIVNQPVVAYQSLRIVAQLSGGSADLQLAWQTGNGSFLNTIQYEWPIMNGAILDVTVPVDGTNVELIWVSVAGTVNSNVQVYGVSRTVDHSAYRDTTQASQGVMGASLGPGGTQHNTFFSIVGGNAYLFFAPHTASSNFSYQVNSLSNAGATNYTLYSPVTPIVQVYQELIVPPTPIDVVFFNFSGAATYVYDWALVRKGV